MHILEHPDFDDHAKMVLTDHLFNLCVDVFEKAKKENRPPRDDTELALLINKDRTNIFRGKSYKFATALKLAVRLRVQTSELFPDKTRWLFTVAQRLYPDVSRVELENAVLELINGE